MKRQNSLKITANMLGLATAMSLQSSCALLPTDTEEDVLENDPVAKAAMPYRMPAEHTYLPSEEMKNQEDKIQYSYASSEQVNQAVRERNLVLGMSMSEVRAAWGNPSDRGFSGSKLSGNERWTYPIGFTQKWALGRSRIVYFESGFVVGWETH